MKQFITILALFSLILVHCAKIPGSEPEVLSVMGTAYRNAPGQNLRVKDRLNPGDRIVTAAGSQVVVAIPRGTCVKIYEKTELVMHRILRAGDAIESGLLNLESGSVFFIVEKLKKGGVLEVKTRTAIVSVRGTAFRLESGDRQAGLAVIDGSVVLEPARAPGKGVLIEAGERAAASAEAVTGKEPIPAGELESLRREANELRAAVARPRVAAPDLRTEEAIRRHYHKIEVVSLDDGTKLVGAIIGQNDAAISVHTVNGVIDIPRSSIVDITMK